MQNKKIVFLASDGESSRWVYNALSKDFLIEAAIIECPISKKKLFKGRIKKIGILKVIGQSLFSILVVPFLKQKARNRKASLISTYNLSNTEFNAEKTYRVASVNDEACKQLLLQMQPDIILVNGTRIINKKILQCTNAFFINMHVGITPWYRGSHGGYWALYNNDAANFGTTIHAVDAGVDTGGVIHQVFTKPTQQDNFTTFPILQIAIGINALKEVLPKVFNNTHKILSNNHKGKMYYQPTIWQYFFGKK